MSLRLIILFSAIVFGPLFASQANAECAPFPQVSWWGKLTHEGVVSYVTQKHGGEWSGYIDKWSRQLASVKIIHSQGKGIKIPSTGVTVKGLQLADYIGKLAQRVEINQCLSKQPGSKKTASTQKTTKKTLKVSEFGKGVNAYRAGEFKTAYEIWLPLANGGNAKAQNALGHLYRSGLGVETDLAISRQWYTKSAVAGDRVGLFSLGDIARSTAKTKGERAKALILIKKAANLNYAAAQYDMASTLQKGQDLPANDAEAYFWVSLALENNYKKAQALKELLAMSLSQAEIQAQSKRVQEWLAKHKK